MTPSERLKEIEAKLAKDPYYMEFEGNADFEFLIARVKKLTEALEFYAIPGHMECDSGLQARKALEEE